MLAHQLVPAVEPDEGRERDAGERDQHRRIMRERHQVIDQAELVQGIVGLRTWSRTSLAEPTASAADPVPIAIAAAPVLDCAMLFGGGLRSALGENTTSDRGAAGASPPSGVLNQAISALRRFTRPCMCSPLE
jgi:hypothetical protein